MTWREMTFVDYIVMIIQPPIAFVLMIYFASCLFGGPLTLPLAIGWDYGGWALVIALVGYNGLGLGACWAVLGVDKICRHSDELVEKGLFVWLGILSLIAIFTTMEGRW